MVSRQRGFFRRANVNITIAGMIVAFASFCFSAILHVALDMNLYLWTGIFDLVGTVVFFSVYWRE